MRNQPRHILPLIVIAQFAGTSLWFAGNAILPELNIQLGLGEHSTGNITSAVQLGFITGTLIFAVIAIADRFKPSVVFFVSSILAAAANLSINYFATDSTSLLMFRFITGFFLAGIYPVGMKIAADWYEKGLGTALGWLVGALVAGTAFPHLLKGASLKLPAEQVIICTSLFAAIGGILVLLFIKEGPYRKRGQTFHPRRLAEIFKSKDFRSVAFGYFGHMWELYAFWTFVPVLLAMNVKNVNLDIPAWSFIVIGVGCLSCIIGGYLSRKWGSAKVAFYSLLISGICCLISGLIIPMSTPIFLVFMIIWGITVISDSPQFSALVAQTAPPESKGTALTFVTCIGFAITIASIELLNHLVGESIYVFMVLGLGPAIGLYSLRFKPSTLNFQP